MKRREVVLGLSALAGVMPVALSLGGMSSAHAVGTMANALAKRGGAIDPPGTILSLKMLALRFSSTAAAVDIDLLFDVEGKLLPHRIATFRAGAVSPQSQLFGFSLDQRAIAGFRVEQCKTGRSRACTTGVETPYRLPVSGSYVLDMDNTGMGVAISPVREGQRFDDPAWLARRRDQSFLAFSVSR